MAGSTPPAPGNSRVRLDPTSLHLLQLLQRNARASITEMAQQVGRSESAVRERVAALEASGVVRRYEARIDWTRLGLPASAMLRGRCALERLDEVRAELDRLPYVTEAMVVTGPRPILAFLQVRDERQLNAILAQLQASGLLQDVEAQLTLDSLVERPPDIPSAPSAQPMEM